MLRFLVLLLVFASSSCAGLADTVRLAITTSFQNSGLADVLIPRASEDTGLEIQLLVVGTGQALKLARSGDVDAVLVHSKTAEEEHTTNGYAPYRREIMFNDFVVVGPSDDPAALRDAENIGEVLRKLETAKDPFVSRGDDSGTHKKELSLWTSAARDPESFGSWYRSVGSGMGAALNTASAMNAYILSDRASWLTFGNKGDLALLFEGDESLFNQYSFLPVSAELHPHVNRENVAKLEEWLTSLEAETLINGYQLNGQRLFTFNAAPSPES